MPAVNPNNQTPTGTLGPGGASTTSGFPQWGVNNAYNIVEAKTDADKTADIAKGYGAWFTSQSAAQAWAQEQQTFLGSGGIPVFSSIEHALSAFYDVLTNGKMWRSLGWLILGVLLMVAGIALFLRKQIGSTIAGTLFPEVA